MMKLEIDQLTVFLLLSHLSFDFEVCWSVSLFVCMYVCLLARSRPQF